MSFFSILSVINFISVLILYGIALYGISEQTKMKEDVELGKEYDRINERQLNNLINDVNKNYQLLQKYIADIQNKLKL